MQTEKTKSSQFDRTRGFKTRYFPPIGDNKNNQLTQFWLVSSFFIKLEVDAMGMLFLFLEDF